MTAFCGVDVSLWDDLTFFVDGNSKITRENGSYDHPVPNAFSLPHISSCPGSTEDCRAGCYVHGLQKNVPETYAKYVTNAATLHRMLLDERDFSESAECLGDWVATNASAGFRWHVSGDVMNRQHAQWIREVCRVAPKVPFWIYTRTFEAIPFLLQAPNLVVNISADSKNWGHALAAYNLNVNSWNRQLRLTYFTRDGRIPDCSQIDTIFPDYPLRGRDLPDPTKSVWWICLTPAQRRKVCPPDFFGQSQEHRCGPCRKCL